MRKGITLAFMALLSCLSEKETCKMNTSVTSYELPCMLSILAVQRCPDRIIAGEVTAEDCARMETNMLLICLEYDSLRSKCKQKSDLPITPKIVMNYPSKRTLSAFWQRRS